MRKENLGAVQKMGYGHGDLNYRPTQRAAGGWDWGPTVSVLLNSSIGLFFMSASKPSLLYCLISSQMHVLYIYIYFFFVFCIL